MRASAMRRSIMVTIFGLLVLSACARRPEPLAPAPAATPPARPAADGAVPVQTPASPAATPSGEAVAAEDLTGVTFVPYENRAKKYTLQRPDRWYWEHLIKSQLPDIGVDDLFRTDPKPLPGIPSETYGRIAVEVSSKNIEDLPSYMKDFSTTRATIGGVNATRYEGLIYDGAIRVIEYRLSRRQEIYRFIFNGDAGDTKGVKIFERVLESFAFPTE